MPEIEDICQDLVQVQNVIISMAGDGALSSLVALFAKPDKRSEVKFCQGWNSMVAGFTGSSQLDEFIIRNLQMGVTRNSNHLLR